MEIFYIASALLIAIIGKMAHLDLRLFPSCFILSMVTTALVASACHVSVDLTQKAEIFSGHVAGILNGINISQPNSALVRRIGLSMWRGPLNRFV